MRIAARRPGATVAVAFVTAMLFSAGVAAQSPHMLALVRASQARVALGQGRTSEALESYRQSVALEAVPRVLREYAALLENNGRLRDAAREWVRLSTTSPSVSERAEALARSEALRVRPSLLRVRVVPALAARTARVWFDHDPPRSVPTGGAESMVDGGTHRVRVECIGFVAYERMVTTAYGEPVEVVVRLVREGDEAPVAELTKSALRALVSTGRVDTRGVYVEWPLVIRVACVHTHDSVQGVFDA